MPARTPPADHLLVARIGAAHGIKGEVRLETFTEVPDAILGYSPLATDRAELTVTVTALGRAGGRTIAALDGVTDRNQAEALTGVGLYVPRSALPKIETENEFYHADLLGLAARTEAGAELGTITGVYNFGAGDILEITPAGEAALMIPFTHAQVPEVDIEGGVVTVVPAPQATEAEDPQASAANR